MACIQHTILGILGRPPSSSSSLLPAWVCVQSLLFCLRLYYRSGMIIIIIIVMAGLWLFWHAIFITLCCKIVTTRDFYISFPLTQRPSFSLIHMLLLSTLLFALFFMRSPLHDFIMFLAFAASCRKCGCAFVFTGCHFLFGLWRVPWVECGKSQLSQSCSPKIAGNTHALMSKNHLRRCYL